MRLMIDLTSNKHMIMLFHIMLILLLFSVTQHCLSLGICPGTSSPNDGYKYCGRFSSEQLKTSLILREQQQQQYESSTSTSTNSCLTLPTIDEEENSKLILNNFFNITTNDLSKYLNSTICKVRWSDDAVITYQLEICALDIYSKTFYVISDGYNVHRFANLSELENITPKYFVNHEMVTSQTSAFEDQIFIISGPNYVLNMKNDIISTSSRHSCNIFMDPIFHFNIISVGEDDLDGPGVILKNVQSGLCITVYSQLRFYFKGEPCSNALTATGAQLISDTHANSMHDKNSFGLDLYSFHHFLIMITIYNQFLSQPLYFLHLISNLNLFNNYISFQ
ncbi:hypothetical protein C9374_007001 [Naegleria lovaniensis]|uniref:Uncharacterized protein n=1 Tax=Naegleria lovaniensis TaxID=51637 RepID=A0AA88GYT7_NAELO|nr:uncharacterized protein C9374_007001 [Naegleria lovaniensis]KAG2393470.1 hypothetical protein C9374_007001 [Naegleria lovaniensis]